MKDWSPLQQPTGCKRLSGTTAILSDIFFLDQDVHLAEIFANFPTCFWKSFSEMFYFLLQLVKICIPHYLSYSVTALDLEKIMLVDTSSFWLLIFYNLWFSSCCFKCWKTYSWVALHWAALEMRFPQWDICVDGPYSTRHVQHGISPNMDMCRRHEALLNSDIKQLGFFHVHMFRSFYTGE